jgi:hypothetical protein
VSTHSILSQLLTPKIWHALAVFAKEATVKMVMILLNQMLCSLDLTMPVVTNVMKPITGLHLNVGPLIAPH